MARATATTDSGLRRRTRNSHLQLPQSLQVLEALLVEYDYTAAVLTVQERQVLSEGLRLVYQRTEAVEQFIREVMLVPEVNLKTNWDHKSRLVQWYLSLVEKGVFHRMEERRLRTLTEGSSE